MAIEATRQEQPNRLRTELDRLLREPLGPCPACREPVNFEDPYVRVNGRYVHAPCARVGIYEEVPV